jgi:hypothetical protein
MRGRVGFHSGSAESTDEVHQPVNVNLMSEPLRNRTHPAIFRQSSLLVFPHVDNSALELPSRNLAIEQDVKLSVRAAFELG